jgi:hypothetical protein
MVRRSRTHSFLSWLSAGVMGACFAVGIPNAHAYKLKMPIRGNSLSTAETYLQTRGHANYNCDSSVPQGPSLKCPLDISALRWDPAAGSWSRSRTIVARRPTSNTDDVMWRVPLHAPVDGQVIACWRGMPDDDVDGDAVNCPGGTGRCIQGGNHVTILTSDGKLLFFGHLQQDSIPTSVCPITETYLYSTDPKVCTLGGDWGGLRSGSRLDLRNEAPREIKKGQFLGRVGTSGSGRGVHLHMHVTEYGHDGVNPCARYYEPLEFTESWYQPRTVGVEPSGTNWTKLQTARLPIDGSSLILWPDPMGPRQDEVHLEAGTLPALVATTSGGVVAFRNAQGFLALTSFGFVSDQFDLDRSTTAGAVSAIALAPISSGRHVVAAVRNRSGNLRVIPYYVTSGSLIRGVGRTEGGISLVDVTRAPSHNGVVVAVKNESGGVSVIDYSVTETSAQVLTVSRNGTATSASTIDNLGIARVIAGKAMTEIFGVFQGVVTAERRLSDNAVVVRSWSVSAQGTVAQTDAEVATAASNNAVFAANDVDVTVVGNSFREFAVVSSRVSPSNSLRLQTWEISTSGQLRRVGEENAGAIGVLASTKVGTRDVITAITDRSSNFLGISWGVGLEGSLRRVGTRNANFVSQVASAGPSGYFTAAWRDSTNEIVLVNYLTNYDASF